MKKNRLTLPMIAVLLTISSAATAEVYRCTDPTTKKLTYSGTPCAAGDERRVSITDNITDGSAARRGTRQQAGDVEDDRNLDQG